MITLAIDLGFILERFLCFVMLVRDCFFLARTVIWDKPTLAALRKLMRRERFVPHIGILGLGQAQRAVGRMLGHLGLALRAFGILHHKSSQ